MNIINEKTAKFVCGLHNRNLESSLCYSFLAIVPFWALFSLLMSTYFRISGCICWLNCCFQQKINVQTTLVHRHWIDEILSKLSQRCFINVETMLINIRRLNFLFKSNLNVETTLVHQRWIDIILSMLF